MGQTDLTGFSALLGESLTSRVDLLERLLGSAHYPSLGQYKERLLADTIRGFLPTGVEVGTGFVLFPHANEDPIDPELYDPLNQSAYSVSRQCDILVFDAAKIPPVFRDGDFVVIRPEALRSVIEVKGSLSREQAKDALRSFDDFAVKWRTTQLFYQEHGQSMTPKPGLYLMAWNIKRNKAGRTTTSPTRLRDLIAEFYSEVVQQKTIAGYPLLSSLYIHNEAETSAIHIIGDEKPVGKQSFGWMTRDGRFTRLTKEGKPFRDKDRTIASLLASLHMDASKSNFNRFFSYTDEIHGREVLEYEHGGISVLWDDVDAETSKRLVAATP